MQKQSFLLGLSSMVVAFSMAVTGCSKPEEKVDANQSTSAEDKVQALPKVKIATESSFVPFSYKDANGQLIGFEIDLAHALCKEAKLDCEVISQDWDGLIPGLQAQKYDAIMAGMSDTAERRKVVAFSEPYYQNALVIVGKKGVEKGPDNLAGKAVATQRSTTASDYLAANFKQAIPKLYDTQENAYLDLEAGRADLMLSDKAPVLSWLKTEKGQGFEIKGQPIEIDDKIAIAFRQNDPLVGKFNMALSALKANGTYDTISQKYFAELK